jgi:hypothetical protein
MNNASGTPSDVKYPASYHAVPEKDLPVYGRPDADGLSAMQGALDVLHGSGEQVMKVKRTRAKGAASFPRGHKLSRRFGADDCALACALDALGLTNYAIRKLFATRGGEPSHGTVTNMVTGPGYADLRAAVGHNQRREHYYDFFDAALRASPSWKVSKRALDESKTAPAGSFYRGGR